jgi:hypothetical protein
MRCPVGDLRQMGTSDERIARSNATFRAANERIRATAESYEMTEGALPFICECADESCTDVLQVPLESYRATRTHPRRFLIALDHEPSEGDGLVVEEAHGYVVFEKTGRAGELLEEEG